MNDDSADDFSNTERMSSLNLDAIYKAQHIIKGIADQTPLIPAPNLSQILGCEMLLKLENMQPIGAFKIRGALNAVANIPEDAKGVVAASTGNHGRGVAYAAKARGIPAVIAMSSMVPQVKVESIKALGAEVLIAGPTQADADDAVERLVKERGFVDISPFDDLDVIAGQGTIGLELMAARPDLKAIITPLSGGGLAGGIALAAKAINPDIRIIGASMENGPAMKDALDAGKPVEVEEFPSLADSLGGGIGMENRYTFALCQELIDEVVLVSEEEIYHAMQMLYYEERIIAEGSCVVGLAAMKAGKITLDGPVAAVITGRNVDMDMYTEIINGDDVTIKDMTIKGQAYR